MPCKLSGTPPEYASWDVTVSTLPARSRLYRLEPYGIGTPWVESLTGYITRLAEALVFHGHPVCEGDCPGRGERQHLYL